MLAGSISVLDYSQFNARGQKVGDGRSRRTVGSQSEVPTVRIAADNSSAIVKGYQRYTLQSSGAVMHSARKYSELAARLRKFRSEDGATTLADIGCSAGIVSLLARHEGYRRVYALDHDPEYIGVLRRVVESVNVVGTGGSVIPSTFDFGDPLPAVDVTICSAIIHWVYCRTAHFANRMDLIFQYLFAATNKFLMIEWVDPADNTILHFRSKSHPAACRKNITHPVLGYNRIAFEHHAQVHGELVEKIATKSTRTMYVFKKRVHRVTEAELKARGLVPDLSCSADGGLSRELSSTMRWEGVLRRPYMLVRLGDGSISNFTHLSQNGVTSTVCVDESKELVLKIQYPRVAALRREMCIYRVLNERGMSWAPRMLCADNKFALLMAHAGDKLTSANIPRDYAARYSAILRDLSAARVKHNDLKTGELSVDSRGRWSYPQLELRVKGGRLTMFDFNMATVNGSHSCRDRYGRNLEHPHYHRAVPDEKAMVALDNLWAKRGT